MASIFSSQASAFLNWLKVIFSSSSVSRFRATRLGFPVVGPAHLRWQGHEDRFGTTARLQAKKGATVIDEVEFDVTTPAEFLEFSLLGGVFVVFAALNNRQVGVDISIANGRNS